MTLILLCTLYKAKADEHTKGFLQHTLTEHYTIGSKKDAVSNLLTSFVAACSSVQVGLSWDLVMAHLGCCGVTGSQDFAAAKKFVIDTSQEGLGRTVL